MRPSPRSRQFGLLLDGRRRLSASLGNGRRLDNRHAFITRSHIRRRRTRCRGAQPTKSVSNEKTYAGIGHTCSYEPHQEATQQARLCCYQGSHESGPEENRNFDRASAFFLAAGPVSLRVRSHTGASSTAAPGRLVDVRKVTDISSAIGTDVVFVGAELAALGSDPLQFLLSRSIGVPNLHQQALIADGASVISANDILALVTRLKAIGYQ